MDGRGKGRERETFRQVNIAMNRLPSCPNERPVDTIPSLAERVDIPDKVINAVPMDVRDSWLTRRSHKIDEQGGPGAC